jgi:hypothetical protein
VPFLAPQAGARLFTGPRGGIITDRTYLDI